MLRPDHSVGWKWRHNKNITGSGQRSLSFKLTLVYDIQYAVKRISGFKFCGLHWRRNKNKETKLYFAVLATLANKSQASICHTTKRKTKERVRGGRIDATQRLHRLFFPRKRVWRSPPTNNSLKTKYVSVTAYSKNIPIYAFEQVSLYRKNSCLCYFLSVSCTVRSVQYMSKQVAFVMCLCGYLIDF